jgi:choline-sulfatase
MNEGMQLRTRDYWYKVLSLRYYSFRLPHDDPPDGLHALAAEYYGAVTWMDQSGGRILDAVNSGY